MLAVRRLNLADGEPFARVTVWCPETLGSALSRDDVEARPFYELLADTAGVHLAGASQTIVAGAASADDAELLGVPTGSPVLICERTTRAADGSSVLFSEHVYPGHRMAFTVDRLPAPAPMRLQGSAWWSDTPPRGREVAATVIAAFQPRYLAMISSAYQCIIVSFSSRVWVSAPGW